MKKIISILYSTRLMAVLFILFAVAMGVATFIENDFGTQTSKALVYNTWWFELIMVFFVINFFGNIFRYRLYKKEKWAVLMFHLAFLLILIGAGATRYIGFEGIMLIKEGESTNKFLSETTYLNAIVDNNKVQKPEINKPMLLSAWGKNSWSYSDYFKTEDTEQDFSFELVEYIPWAERKLVEDENGVDHLFFVESSEGGRHEHWIQKGTIQNIHGVLVGFNAESDNPSINFIEENGNLKMVSKDDGDWFRMADQKKGNIVKDSLQNFQYLTLHNVSGLQFVIPKPAEKGIMKTTSGPKDDKKLDVVVVDIKSNGKTERVELTGGKYNSQGSKEVTVGGLNFRLLYGAKILETPFLVKLNDFQLEKYPGSESAASYASEVTVIDGDESFDYRIFMNHILDHKGYKFFQSSYDLSGPVEETHLSVNHDFVGTFITYLGYSFLYTGLICILFAKHTRFNYLKESLKKIRKKKLTLSIVATLLLSSFSFTQETAHAPHEPNQITNQQIDSILQANLVDVHHAESFNKLVIQDAGGRMKPAHTFASELVRKVSKSETFKGMQPSQVLLSIIENPRLWFEVPIVYLEKGNSKIREVLSLPVTTTHARLSDFITPTGAYKIKDDVAEAQKKNIKNKYENDLIKIDKRVGLLYSAIGGGILRIYPIPNDDNNTWVSQPETSSAGFKATDSVFVRQSLPVYIQLLQEAKKSNDYTKADQILDGIKKFQKKFGTEVYPSQNRIDLEITYNKWEIFTKTSLFYLILGLLLIFIEILKIFYYKSKVLGYIVKGLIVLTVLSFLFHTFGLASRWYISGNAPWSNAYESIIYVAWATMLFGLFLGKKSTLTIGATTFLAAIILFFAHQNWLDPAIANLQPVLNSWWLMVHVSIIVASYGPFSLAMILGIISLILIVFTTEKNKKRMDINIKELTIINEMAISVGLVMLTIGNFLGGMWANESWGRYWGWDPKETWALISIMVYAFVLHMRLIPGLRSRLAFNFASAFSYLAIMMTYFGVNFYLSGLHSYASGDKAVTPREAYIYIGALVLLTVLASFKYKKYFKK
ncbi:cytochrome c biogenesis protein CcsA [Polaribacter sp. HaHaR_3_91]|uniref:cytochrome c biogenesis protein CcsA n=1 Tax=Polaribacter sp. HaHaR_3_91 TaxID=2745561 RepID=UPI001C4F1E18|nr:cytochrome c biogenesis protein CcsA [Polaribacter sp. HaHaR_3_91]QXP64503.1 cytochrome c biogenesis protein CcsA [Polaribacter sp. HaHaR_3_91]